MAVIINQTPLYGDSQNGALPVGQQIIFTVSQPSVIDNYWNVKFIAEVHISAFPINLSTSDALVATFKTTPNNAGVGIFDFRSLFESYVSTDNLGKAAGTTAISQYKGVDYSLETPHPIHLIDKYCRSQESIKYFAIQFKTEGSSTTTAPVLPISNSAANTEQFTFFNGVLQHDNYLTLGLVQSGSVSTGSNYGYDLDANLLYTAGTTSSAKFLTNAPTTQYATINDYGTMAFLNFLPTSSDRVAKIVFRYYDSDGNSLGNSTRWQNNVNGGATNIGGTVHSQLLYVGCYPANLRNWSSAFQDLVTAGTIQGGYYTIQAETDGGTLQQMYTINVKCPDLRGYESVRLTWLNQWGAWDYYTFTQKSTRNISTKGSTYEQLAGTWNDSSYRVNGFKGGKKTFRVNATEKIKMNTDFVSENDNVMFEELTNSPEVYILAKYSDVFDVTTVLNQYVTPVRITSTNFTKKTVANDKLIQYTFEVEKSKTLRTQSI